MIHDGGYPQKAPLGYANIRLENSKSEIIIDKMCELFIKKAFAMRLAGVSVYDITKETLDIDNELVKLEQGADGTKITASNPLKLVANIEGVFESSKPAVKNQILRLVVSNLRIQQKRLQFTLLEPFATLVEMNSRIVWCT